MNDVSYYIGVAIACVITSLVSAAVGALLVSYKKHREEDAGLKNSQRYLLKDRITQSCQHWLERGYCPIHNREVIVEMTDCYHALGGNSFVSGLVEKVLALPVEQSGVHHEES